MTCCRSPATCRGEDCDAPLLGMKSSAGGGCVPPAIPSAARTCSSSARFVAAWGNTVGSDDNTAMTNQNDTDDERVFQTCPECGGRIEHQTVADMMCRDCGAIYCHERRSEESHLLWSYDDESRLDEVVARV